MSASPFLTSEGVRRFQCIGGACEFTCCAGWRVPVDGVHLKVLTERLGETVEGSRELAAAFTAPPEGAAPHHAAEVRLRENGDCPFLAADKLCSLQARFGEEVLPNTCVQYPRQIGEVRGRQEAWGLLSCPEMGRRVLLAEDGMQLAESPNPLARPLRGKALTDPDRPYHRYLDDVRQAVLGVLSQRAYPLTARLFFLAYLGKRTEGFFHAQAADVEAARLKAELDRLRSPEVLQSWAQGFEKLEVPARVASGLVLAVLKARLDRNLAPLAQRVLSAFTPEEGVLLQPNGAMSVRHELVWGAYQRRRAAWEERHRAHLDLRFENHAQSYWMQEWYTGSANLLVHLETYLVRLALVRFLVFRHPELDALTGLSPAAQRAGLDRVIVEVVSRVARAVEHEPGFARQLQGIILEGGALTFAHAAILCRA